MGPLLSLHEWLVQNKYEKNNYWVKAIASSSRLIALFSDSEIIGQKSKAVQNVTKLPSYSWREGLYSSLDNNKSQKNTEQ